MFRAVADGRIKALWIMATNPVDSMPDADAVEAAISACPFVVVSDVHGRDRHRSATPMCGCRPPPGARRTAPSPIRSAASRASARFLPLPGRGAAGLVDHRRGRQAHGFREAFAYASPAEIFAEHAALSAFENDGARDFDIGAHAGDRRTGV